jgi:hypothetical protein
VTKQEIIKLLEGKRYDELIDEARKDIKGVFRRLIGVSYDKESIICWRAIEVIGIISGDAARTETEVIRSLAQRLLWMMRDESGNNPWSAPEMLGEIVRNCPDAFADIAPVILSFHDEHILRRGVLRAAVRISEVRPGLLSGCPIDFIGEYITDPDGAVRFYALLLAGQLKAVGFITDIKMLINDRTVVKIYDSDDFRFAAVGDAAQRVYSEMNSEER